jgi:hypothetical protein
MALLLLGRLWEELETSARSDVTRGLWKTRVHVGYYFRIVPDPSVPEFVPPNLSPEFVPSRICPRISCLSPNFLSRISCPRVSTAAHLSDPVKGAAASVVVMSALKSRVRQPPTNPRIRLSCRSSRLVHPKSGYRTPAAPVSGSKRAQFRSNIFHSYIIVERGAEFQGRSYMA